MKKTIATSFLFLCSIIVFGQNPLFTRDSATILIDVNYSFDRNYVLGNRFYNGNTEFLEDRQPATLFTAGVGATFRIYKNFYFRGGFACTQKGYGPTLMEETNYYSGLGTSGVKRRYTEAKVINFFSLPIMLELSYLNIKHINLSFTAGVMCNILLYNESGTCSDGSKPIEFYVAPVSFNLRAKRCLLRLEPNFRHLNYMWSCEDNGSKQIKTYSLTLRLGVY